MAKAKRAHMLPLFEAVFSNELILSNVDGAFTPKNFAVTKWLVELAAKGLVLIDGMVFRNVDLSSYVQSRFAKAIRIRRIEWPERLDPASALCRVFAKGQTTEEEQEEEHRKLMVQIFRDNVEHLQNLCVYLNLDVDCSAAAREEGFLSETVSDFLGILPQCVGLETLCVMQTYYIEKHARQESLHVKVMEIMRELPRLTGVEWNGNLTEDRWHPAEEGAVAVRWNLFDYLRPDVTELLISDGKEPRTFAWEDKEGFAAVLKAVMGNKEKRFPKLESLLLPKGFWGADIEHFTSFIEHIDAGNIEEIGFADDFSINLGPLVRVLRHPVYRCWNLPAPKPRLDLLVRSLTRGMTVDLGVCKDVVERGVRMAWAESLTKGTGAFYKCERAEERGFTFFSLWKKYTGEKRGSEFEVLIRI